MQRSFLRRLPARVGAGLVVLIAAGRTTGASELRPDDATARAQTPSWTEADTRFFLHGSMSTEVVPETVLRAFQATYPELFPAPGLSAFGFLDDPASDLPIGFSRGSVAHLGGLSSVGINCAACHVAEITPTFGGPPVRVLGVTSHVDVEAFFGSVAAATFQTADPGNMERFLGAYVAACSQNVKPDDEYRLFAALQQGRDDIAAATRDELAALRRAADGALLEIDGAALMLDAARLARDQDVTPIVRSLLRLFHNMRTALHIPHQPPQEVPPRSGPGRNNAFGVLSIALFGEPTIYGPAKFGVAWNLEGRSWVHWDGNTRSPIIRNLAASLGLGAPLIGRRGVLDFALVERHTRLSEQIRAPRYPWRIDATLAARGGPHFAAHCARCHAPGSDAPRDIGDRLYAVDEIGTDPNRAQLFDLRQAELYNRFFAELELGGYRPPAEPPVRSTQKYVAPDLAGVWARSPYLHNGSVRTIRELLTPAGQRARSFKRGSRLFDETDMGYTDDGPFSFDTATPGNASSGHEYGIDLTPAQQRELIEYLKSL